MTVATGTKVHWMHAHPNNLLTVVEVGGSQMVEHTGIRYAFTEAEVYQGQPSEEHWSAFLARNTWAVR